MLKEKDPDDELLTPVFKKKLLEKTADILHQEIRRAKQEGNCVKISLPENERRIIDFAHREIDPTHFTYEEYEGPERINNKYSFMVSVLIDKAIGPVTKDCSTRIFGDALTFKLERLRESWTKAKFLLELLDVEQFEEPSSKLKSRNSAWSSNRLMNGWIKGPYFKTNLMRKDGETLCMGGDFRITIDRGEKLHPVKIGNFYQIIKEISDLLESGAYLGIPKFLEDRLREAIKDKSRWPTPFSRGSINMKPWRLQKLSATRLLD